MIHTDVCCVQTNGHGPDTHGLVTIRMKPDAQGRFGFNVKVRQVLFVNVSNLSMFSFSIV